MSLELAARAIRMNALDTSDPRIRTASTMEMILTTVFLLLRDFIATSRYCCFLYFQELADGKKASHDTDDKTGERIGDGHHLDDLPERDDGDELQGVDRGDLGLEEVVQAPLEEEADRRAQEAQDEALDHERQPDEAVRGADHFHDRDLLAPVVHGQLDRVGDDQQGYDEEHDNDDHRGDVEHLLQGLEAVGDLIVRRDLGHAVDLPDLVDGLLHEGVVLHRDHIAVAERVGVEAVEEGGIILLLGEILQSLFPRNELRVEDVGDHVDLRTDALGLGLGIIFVDIDEDLILLLEIDDHDMQIVEDQAERAHDDETGNRHADGGEGHEPVEKNASDAFAEQIADIILLH